MIKFCIKNEININLLKKNKQMKIEKFTFSPIERKNDPLRNAKIFNSVIKL